jgi:prepilin-type processing-associated H-X9-DG protein
MYYFGDGSTPKTLQQMVDDCQQLGAVTSFTFGLGGNWLGPNFELGNTYQHLMTPNKRNCRYGGSATESQLILNVAITAGSNHPGGVNVCMCDGSVQFVSNSVDQRVWWAMGSNNSND